MKRGKKIKIVESKNNESEIDNKTSFYKSKRKELQTKQNHKGRGQRTWKEKKKMLRKKKCEINVSHRQSSEHKVS